MKKIKYNLYTQINIGTSDKPFWKETKGNEKQMDFSEENLSLARSEAWQGEVEIVDDGQPDPADTPTQLDRVEAQVTYTAMMTDTLLEG